MIRVALLFFALLVGSSAHAITTIRVLFLFTPEGKAYIESFGQTMASITAQEVAKTNNTFFLSGIDAQIESAGIIPNICCGNANFLLPWTMTEEGTDALDWASKSLGVAQAHDAANADIVMIISNYPGDISGRSFGWKGPYKAIVGVDALVIDEYASTHEIGHTMGAHHQSSGGQWFNDGRSTPYIYGHGFWYRSAAHCYHTIMSSPSADNGVPCSSDVEISRFSNPAQAIYANDGVFPLGSSLANNVQVLNNTKSQVGSYRVASWMKRQVFITVIGPMLTTLILE